MSLVEQALKFVQAQAAARTAGSPRPALQPAEPATRLPRATLTLDLAALRTAGLLPGADSERQIAQQFRQIKRPLIENALGRGATPMQNAQLIMVASAMPGEGKTFTSINLAMSMAREKDTSILLIDSDVLKPHISQVFGAGNAPGLLDALRDPSIDVENLVLQTNVPNLLFLPAGGRTDNGTELLASARMQELAHRLAGGDANRILLFDSPPLLLTTESLALAHATGQIVVVVKAAVTPQSVLLDALSYLAARPAVFLVLNQSSEEAPSGYYYYGYGEASPDSRSV
jgi:protein-tyrosine kinase